MTSHLITGEELQRLVPDARIMTYPELEDVEDIDQILPPRGKIALLYVNKKAGGSTVGHWTGLTRRGNTVEVYDSYNMAPDDQFRHIDRKATDQENNFLSRLLLQHNMRGGKVEYNERRHQKLDPSIQTCGRHVAMRLMFGDVPLRAYQREMERIKGAGKTVDDFSVYLTNKLLKQ